MRARSDAHFCPPYIPCLATLAFLTTLPTRYTPLCDPFTLCTTPYPRPLLSKSLHPRSLTNYATRYSDCTSMLRQYVSQVTQAHASISSTRPTTALGTRRSGKRTARRPGSLRIILSSGILLLNSLELDERHVSDSPDGHHQSRPHRDVLSRVRLSRRSCIR